MTTASQQASRWWWLPVAFTYVVALMLPAVYRPGLGAPTSGLTGYVEYGYECLGGLPFALLSPAWWANPAWLLGMIALVRNRPKLARICGLVGAFLALSVFVIGPFPPDNFGFSDMRLGYYIWLASMLALVVIAQFQIRSPSRLGELGVSGEGKRHT